MQAKTSPEATGIDPAATVADIPLASMSQTIADSSDLASSISSVFDRAAKPGSTDSICGPLEEIRQAQAKKPSRRLQIIVSVARTNVEALITHVRTYPHLAQRLDAMLGADPQGFIDKLEKETTEYMKEILKGVTVIVWDDLQTKTWDAAIQILEDKFKKNRVIQSSTGAA